MKNYLVSIMEDLVFLCSLTKFNLNVQNVKTTFHILCKE